MDLPLDQPEVHRRRMHSGADLEFMTPTVDEGRVMTEPGHSIHDRTHDDHERFERRHLARDQDARRPQTVTVDESEVAKIVRGLIAADVVDVVADEQVLRHAPSKRLFESNRALVLFHRGWEAREEDE